jgi:hypothetical protein
MTSRAISILVLFLKKAHHFRTTRTPEEHNRKLNANEFETTSA